VDKIFHTQPATIAGPIHTQPPREDLAIVECATDHHVQDDKTIIQQLADAVATGDRDEVFFVAKRLVDSTPAVGEQLELERLIETIVIKVGKALLATRKESHYWRLDRAAEACNVSPRTFAEWLADGKVHFFKLGRVVLIDPVELKADLSKFHRQRTPRRRMRRTE
jgi:hypothetical protein